MRVAQAIWPTVRVLPKCRTIKSVRYRRPRRAMPAAPHTGCLQRSLPAQPIRHDDRLRTAPRHPPTVCRPARESGGATGRDRRTGLPAGRRHARHRRGARVAVPGRPHRHRRQIGGPAGDGRFRHAAGVRAVGIRPRNSGRVDPPVRGTGPRSRPAVSTKARPSRRSKRGSSHGSMSTTRTRRPKTACTASLTTCRNRFARNTGGASMRISAPRPRRPSRICCFGLSMQARRGSC